MIRITEDYTVDVDSLNYTAKVDLHTTDKKGNLRTKTIGYYSTLRDAVAGIVEYDARQNLSGGEKTLEEAIKILDNRANRIEELLWKIPE